VVGSCEHGNEPSVWECVEWLRNCWLLKKDSNPWDYIFIKFVDIFMILQRGNPLFYRKVVYSVLSPVPKDSGFQNTRPTLLNYIIILSRV
jgi:hypothetical protein